MPKISKRQMAQDEFKVMAEVKRDPSLDAHELSKKLGFSPSKIYKILRKYNKGTNKKQKQDTFGISGVNIENNKRKFLILARRNHEKLIEENFPNIINASVKKYSLRNEISLDSCILTNGISDWLFCISSEDLIHITMFSKFLQNNFKEYIEDVNIIELLDTITLGEKLDKDTFMNYSNSIITNRGS